MLLIYPAIIHEDPDGFWVELPDLAGCQSQGDDMQELLANAGEALEAYALYQLENNAVLPHPCNPIDIHLEDSNSFVSLIQANVDLAKNTKSVKKTLTIPKWLNDRAIAAKNKFFRSFAAGVIKRIKNRIIKIFEVANCDLKRSR